jgi:hypothetical protein
MYVGNEDGGDRKRKQGDQGQSEEHTFKAAGISFTVIDMSGKKKPAKANLLTRLIVASLMIAFCLIAVVMPASFLFAPNLIPRLFGLVETQPVQGDPAKFDPVFAYGSVAAYAGAGARLISIEASQVRVDGTMDLTATYVPAPYTEYEFAINVPPPDNAPPVGAGGSSTGQWFQPVTVRVYEPGQRRQVRRTSNGTRLTFQYVNEGMVRDADDTPTSSAPRFVEEAPQCSFVDFWQTALERGAPRDAVANISYDADGYEFRISGAGVNLEFGFDCKVR